MTNQQLETFLFQYTESEQRHLREQPPQLSPRYRNIPKVVYNGREMYQFNFGSLLKNRSVCVNKESRFTVIPEHIHSVIEFLYVDRKSTRLNSSHPTTSRMPSSA